jgi:2-keto-3-deoxy-L-rhamnonate aldolase RhmA
MRGMATGKTPAADWGRGNAVETTRAAREETLIVVPAESRTAVANVDRTLDGSRVDVIMVGPGNLSQSLGLAGQMDLPKQ